MPIEIKELVIKATVTGGTPTSGVSGAGKEGDNDTAKLQHVIDEVIKKLNEKNER